MKAKKLFAIILSALMLISAASVLAFAADATNLYGIDTADTAWTKQADGTYDRTFTDPENHGEVAIKYDPAKGTFTFNGEIGPGGDNREIFILDYAMEVKAKQYETTLEMVSGKAVPKNAGGATMYFAFATADNKMNTDSRIDQWKNSGQFDSTMGVLTKSPNMSEKSGYTKISFAFWKAGGATLTFDNFVVKFTVTEGEYVADTTSDTTAAPETDAPAEPVKMDNLIGVDLTVLNEDGTPAWVKDGKNYKRVIDGITVVFNPEKETFTLNGTSTDFYKTIVFAEVPAAPEKAVYQASKKVLGGTATASKDGVQLLFGFAREDLSGGTEGLKNGKIQNDSAGGAYFDTKDNYTEYTKAIIGAWVPANTTVTFENFEIKVSLIKGGADIRYNFDNPMKVIYPDDSATTPDAGTDDTTAPDSFDAIGAAVIVTAISASVLVVAKKKKR